MDTKELSKVQKDRKIKLEKLRSQGFDYPNDFEKKYPLGFGKSKNLNDLIIFLLSDKSSWITGVNIDLDGGYKL